jgi:hypothetical protein
MVVARLTTYRFRVDPHELATKAQDGMLPLLEGQPGFRGYSLFADGSEVQRGPRGMGAPHMRQIIAITLWDSRADAEAGIPAAWDWVRQNMGDEVEWTDTEFMEVWLDTSLGVNPSVGAP